MDFLNGLGETVSSLWEKIVGLFPTCPIDFIHTIPEVEKYLGMLNWFMPIDTMISFGVSWVLAIAVYYGIQLILRWIKAIE